MKSDVKTYEVVYENDSGKVEWVIVQALSEDAAVSVVLQTKSQLIGVKEV